MSTLGDSIKENILFFAGQYNLDPNLVASVVFQESGGIPSKRRYENGFFLRYLASAASRHDLIGHVPAREANISLPTEIRDRAYSWGLMQVMGQTARENGFVKDSFLELLQVPDNIEIGCKVLAGKINKANGDVREGLLLWNGGGDPTYPDSVLGHLAAKDYEKVWG